MLSWYTLILLLLIIFHSFLKCSLFDEACPQCSMELLFALSVCLEYTYNSQSTASSLRQGPCLDSLCICLLHVYLVLIDLFT